MGRSILIFLLGALTLFIALKIIQKKTLSGSSASTSALKQLLKTDEAMQLVDTTEFSNLAKTPEFKKFVSTLASETINTLTTELL